MKDAEIRAKIKDGWLRIKTIHEIAGFPQEHVSKTLKLLSTKISESKDLEVIAKSQHDPKQISDKMWSAFIELEFLTPSASNLLLFVLDFLPSSIDILEPEKVTQNTQEITEGLNDLIAKVHSYNQALSQISAENVLLKKTLKPILDKQQDSK